MASCSFSNYLSVLKTILITEEQNIGSISDACNRLDLCHLIALWLTDSSRKLEQQELEATYTDAWAVGGSDESDCVCRGGRCPRMWDCPFWVDRRRAEAKGSSAHVRNCWYHEHVYCISFFFVIDHYFVARYSKG